MKKGSECKKFLLFQLPYIFYISFLLYWFYDTYADDKTINYFRNYSGNTFFSDGSHYDYFKSYGKI